MRPTIDEQLMGANRLLVLAEQEAIPDAVAELIGNARRLINRVSDSWNRSLPFFLDDNARLAELLHSERVPSPADLAFVEVVARNEELRGDLAKEITSLGDEPADRQRKAEIGTYLQWRVAADPT